MEVNWIVIIILAVIIISIVIIVFSFLINPSAISNFLKEACLLTVGKIFANPKVCEVFRV
ncbi:MAG: hypothetical protein QW197_01955 [Candidatus Aenigmatarchaeota archaeon]